LPGEGGIGAVNRYNLWSYTDLLAYWSLSFYGARLMSVRLINLGAGVFAQALLIAVSSALQGSFSMQESASVFVLGATALALLCRFAFLPTTGRAFFFVGAVLACLWYPVVFVLLSAGIGGYPKLTPLGFLRGLLEALGYTEVLVPTLSFVAASLCGLLLGLGIKKLRSSATNVR
jgi:hypothetical protein